MLISLGSSLGLVLIFFLSLTCSIPVHHWTIPHIIFLFSFIPASYLIVSSRPHNGDSSFSNLNNGARIPPSRTPPTWSPAGAVDFQPAFSSRKDYLVAVSMVYLSVSSCSISLGSSMSGSGYWMVFCMQPSYIRTTLVSVKLSSVTAKKKLWLSSIPRF
ncbi:hypothetical protein C8Q75DRAFT_518168 [Abortiporus biennis]|nr:hypothetical protein C8Q75DRAFT_518168 [Abortiporus biennis]